LRFALLASAPFIVILDADFARGLISEERTSILLRGSQACHPTDTTILEIKPEQSWVERGAGSYRSCSIVSYKSTGMHWGCICVGTCGTYRRESLVPFGARLRISMSEDVHTGFNVLNDGWRVKYILCALQLVCPDNLSSFSPNNTMVCWEYIVVLNRDWRSNLTVMQKVAFLSGMLYY
jgi:hypothetical protein